MPTRICPSCQQRLDDSYQFTVLLLESQDKLDELSKTEVMMIEEVEHEDDDEPQPKKRQVTIPEKQTLDSSHPKESFFCDNCSYSSCKKNDLLLHFRNVHITHEPISEKLRVLCQECGCSLRNNSDLRRHYNKKHLKIVRFSCANCSYTSYEKKAMELHEKKHLPAMQRETYACDQCHVVLSTKHTLKAHQDTVHRKLRPFSCFCGQSFGQKSSLNKHVQAIHEQLKLFECDICFSAFSQKSYMKQHKELMHSAVKPKYPCDECHLAFSTRLAMRNHTRIHNEPEFECAECEKKFHHKANLLDHQEHHRTLEFPCEHCKRSFRKEAKLKQHLKAVHFKPKLTYSCELCSSTFTRRTTYRDHVQRQHKDHKELTELLERIAKAHPDERQATTDDCTV